MLGHIPAPWSHGSHEWELGTNHSIIIELDDGKILTGNPNQFDGKNYHGFPVEIFPTQPIHWYNHPFTSDFPGSKAVAFPRVLTWWLGPDAKIVPFHGQVRRLRPLLRSAWALWEMSQIWLNLCESESLPSGKHTTNYGKSPFSMGKSTNIAIEHGHK